MRKPSLAMPPVPRLRRLCLGLLLLGASLGLPACVGFGGNVPSSPPASLWYLYPSVGVHPGGAGHGGPPEVGLGLSGRRSRAGLNGTVMIDDGAPFAGRPGRVEPWE